MTKKGLFITFEGGEGTGKSTQVKLLQQALSASGVDVIATREPGGTEQAERIRNLLLQRDSGSFDPLTEVLLLFAARREHLVHKILPALEKGQWVISDRFADSSRAMQGHGMGVSLDDIESIYKIVAGDFHPDLTFVFDIDPKDGLNRSLKQLATTTNALETTEDRYERMGLPFHQRIHKGFLETAKKYSDRSVLVDAMQTVDAIHRQILQTIEQRSGITLQEAKYG